MEVSREKSMLALRLPLEETLPPVDLRERLDIIFSLSDMLREEKAEPRAKLKDGRLPAGLLPFELMFCR